MVAGEPWKGDNPRLTTPIRYFDFIKLWAVCRGPDGNIVSWPENVGPYDHAAWTIDAFALLEQYNAEIEKARRSLSGDT